MTECERIIAKNEGITAEYLREEIRDEFTVDTDRKKIWTVLLDLALELDRVCEKYGLRWFLVGGSQLGAVRHKGFIPWDDDMDAAMPRADYEKLLQHADEFSAPYFLQTAENDPGYGYSFTKLRNSNTSAITWNFAWQPMNQGIALDVFPLDPWIPEEGEPLYEQVKALSRDNSAYMRRSNPDLDEAGKKRAAEWSGRDPRENCRMIEALARSFEGKKTGYLSHAVITVDDYPNNYFPEECFRELIRVPFEQFSFPVPAGYDRFLTQEYGDYMAFPPVESRGTKHAEFVLEPDVPYRDFLKEHGIG